jgi:hypothetical protein
MNKGSKTLVAPTYERYKNETEALFGPATFG